MFLKTSAAVILVTAALCAQPAALQFEVASIRPVAPVIAGSGAQVSVGVHVDRNQFRANAMAMREYLSLAYNLRIYQIEGPDWITSERFDINATLPPLPEGRTFAAEDLGAMVRALIEERFQLRSHRIPKEFPAYALVQLKDGIKATEAPLDATDGSSVTVGGTGGAQGTVISLGRGSTLSVGGNRIEAKKFSMLALAETLARFVDRPVVDQTGLTSTYDIALEMTQQDFQALMIRAAVAAGVTLPPQAMKILDVASGDSLHEALAKVGLKLEAKKVPLEVLVVDSINRSPSEN